MANMEGNDQGISGKKFLPLFGVGLIVFMIVGILVTWAIGRALMPYYEKQARDRNAAREEMQMKRQP